MERRKIQGNNVPSKKSCHQDEDDRCRREGCRLLGESKKTYNAQVIRLSSAQAPASSAATKNVPEDQFCFELADPAPSTANQRAPEVQQGERFPTILKTLDNFSEKIDKLSDTLSG